jgi:hypothetical protein
MDEHTWIPDGELPARLAAVLDAAARPGDARELAGEAVARAAFRDHYRIHRLPGRPAVLLKLFPVKVALAALGALSAVGVAAAATDTLPGPLAAAGHGAAVGAAAAGTDSSADRTARLELCRAARGPVAAEREPAAAALTALAGRADRVAAYCAEVLGADRGGQATGPDAAGSGLCRAWQAGQGIERGGKELAAAFTALARAAGGTERVAAYCVAAARTAADPAAPPISTPSRHAPATMPSHPVPPAATERSGGPGSRPTPAPTAPPGLGRTGTP